MRSMIRMRARILVLCSGAAAGSAAGQSGLGPMESYLIPEAEEIALALSAGPANVTGDARVMVLRRGGYATAREGRNGFTCLVQRGWASPLMEGQSQDFWLPELRAPICYNPAASRTVMTEYLRRTELALAGKSGAEIRATVLAEIGSGKLRPPVIPAMAYMLSEGQYIGRDVGRWHPHIMLYLPFADSTTVGNHGIESGLPLMFDHIGGPFATFVLAVRDFVKPKPVAAGRE